MILVVCRDAVEAELMIDSEVYVVVLLRNPPSRRGQ